MIQETHFRKREVMGSLSFCLEKCILSFCFDLSSHAPRDEVKITYRFLIKLEIGNNVDLTSVVLRFENICNFMCFYLLFLFGIIQEKCFRKREVSCSLCFFWRNIFGHVVFIHRLMAPKFQTKITWTF